MVHEAIRRRASVAALSLAAAAAMPAAADRGAPATIAQVKASIVAVGTFERLRNPQFSFAGTGFVVGDGLLVATNDHVVPKTLNNERGEAIAVAIPGADSMVQIRAARRVASNAGSDLANAQASAVRDGDNWIINGHKVWTSLAHFASWMIMVTRTSNDHKYNGLTYFIVPIADTKGVTVRPLIKITGETGFNEVLFEDVVVPDKFRDDDVGKGWTVAMTTLLYERGAAEGAGSGGGVSLDERIASLISLAKRSKRDGKPAWEDAIIRDRVAQLAIRVEGMRQVHRRLRVESLTDHPMRLPLQAKVTVSELMQDIAAVALEIEGPAASLYVGDPGAPDNGQWPLAYLNSYGFTIAAGSNEIQRNILGERVLGLAKSK